MNLPLREHDPTVFVHTAETFIKEIIILADNLCKEQDLFPKPMVRKLLLQLKDSAQMLDLANIGDDLSQLLESAPGDEPPPCSSPPLEKLKTDIRVLDAEIKTLVSSQDFDTDSGDMPLNGMRILVAEDMKTTRIHLKKILQVAGADVHLVANGKLCIETFYRDGPFDLIIMDIFMPELTGLEATLKLRQLGATVPIIALTGLASRDDRQECISAGCTDYVTKPIDADVLVASCKKYAPPSVSPRSSSRPGGPAVLAVTDNKTLQVFLREMLLKMGAQPETVDHDEDAFHLFLKRKDDWKLVIFDDKLEQKSWDEFVRLLRSIRDDIPLVPIIDRADLDTMQDAIALGCVRVLPRPPRYLEIRQLLERVLIDMPPSATSADVSKDTKPGETIEPGEQSTSRLGCHESCDRIAVFHRAYHDKGGDRLYCRRFNLHGRCGFVLADVAGHDNRSAIAASWLTGLLEGLWSYYQEPGPLLDALNAYVDATTDRGMESRFICVLALLYDGARNKLHYANAGIPPGYLVDMLDPEQSRLIQWSGTPIGLLPGVASFEAGTIDFRPGHRLFIATDGIFESVSQEVTTKIYDYFVYNSLQDTVREISQYFLRATPREDDLTIAVLEADDVHLGEGAYRFSIQSTYEEIDSVMNTIDTFLENQIAGNLDTVLTSTAIRESLLNAVEHGNRKIKNRFVDIELIPRPDELEVVVSDEGPGFDYNLYKKQVLKNKDDAVQGRGLFAMEKVVSRLDVQGGSVKLTFALETNTPPQNQQGGSP